jgi:large subunit ribosomal protein L9
MEVILLERIGRLGQMGDVVKVKDGYARNYLLRTGRALRATEANREKFERDRAGLEARNAEARDAAKAGAGSIEGNAYVVIRQAGESGQLYGSVSTRDIAEVVSAGGNAIARTQVLLNAPIKTIGMHEVKVALHPEVIVTITANVARSADEAEAQARGEVLVGNASDREEARRAAEALFAEEEAAAAAEEAAEPEGEQPAA